MTADASAAKGSTAGIQCLPEEPVAGPLLSVRGVSKRFVSKSGSTQALAGVDLDVHAGQFVSLVGVSGCGKTTLLRIIDGLESPDAGEMTLAGEALKGISRDLAFVFQDINLLPWRSVKANVELGLEARGLGRRERSERANRALEMVGLATRGDSSPYTLSGGMQQRVGVARALAVEPRVLLMDEPLGQLDNFTREVLQRELASLCERLGITVVFVTHDVDEAIFLSDRIALFQASPGRITETISVDLPRPRASYDVRSHPAAIDLRRRVMEHLHIREGVEAG